MNIASLFATLGFKVDPATFAKANAALAKLRASATKTVDGIRAGFGKLRGVLTAALGVGASIYGLGKLADAYTGAASRIRQLTDDTAEQKRLQDALFASAQNTATAYEDQVSLFQKVAKATKAQGRPLSDAVSITDTLAKALKSSGADAQGAANALGQLGQALDSGALQGDEFRSVMEGAPILLELLQKETGKSRKELREMAKQGKITSELLIKTFAKSAGAVATAYGKRIPQVGDLFTRLGNNVKKALGEIAQDKEVMAALTTLIEGVSDALVVLIKGFATFAKFLVDNKEIVLVALAAISAALLVFAGAAIAAWVAAAGPVLLVALAVAAVGAAIAALIIYWDDVVAAVKKAVSWFLKWTPIGWQIRGIMFLLGKAIDGVRWAIAKVADGSAWRAIVDAATWVGDTVGGVFEWIGGKIQYVIDLVASFMDKVSEAYDYIASGNIFGDIGDLLAGDGPAVSTGNSANPQRVARAAALAGATNSTTNVGPTTINVSAPNAQAAADAVNKALETRMREASAATAGNVAR